MSNRSTNTRYTSISEGFGNIAAVITILIVVYKCGYRMPSAITSTRQMLLPWFRWEKFSKIEKEIKRDFSSLGISKEHHRSSQDFTWKLSRFWKGCSTIPTSADQCNYSWVKGKSQRFNFCRFLILKVVYKYIRIYLWSTDQISKNTYKLSQNLKKRRL